MPVYMQINKKTGVSISVKQKRLDKITRQLFALARFYQCYEANPTNEEAKKQITSLTKTLLKHFQLH